MKDIPDDYSLENFKHDYQLRDSLVERQIPSSSDREKLHSWVIDLFPDLKCSVQTRILGCYYLDEFLLKKPEINPQVYQLATVICLGIALKFEESIILTPKNISELFNNRYSEENVTTVELYILKALNWRLAQITPSDVIRSLIFATCEKGDLTKIIEKAELFALVGILSNKTAKYREGFLAVACTSLALKTLGFVSFLEEWWLSVSKTLEISRQDVEMIEKKIINLVS
ncbi:hypothetical protein SteCoe_33135 [Stentor coeruleus]|uniref:Cyclin N-terminal domain-containing protein n=1 Tax=Stentor coeruleus TaxID=5963 RepID=A0A1R2AXG1_9CILI|nr:hypothetical protein SteCoe_33135 [Stentor coeruleus]